MGNEFLAALLKNKYFHQKIFAKCVVITIALLLMTSFLHSATAQVQPMKYSARGYMVDIYYYTYDPEFWCPYEDFSFNFVEYVQKMAPQSPGPPVPGSMGYLYIYKDDCEEYYDGYAESMDLKIEAVQGTLASASIKGTATIEYYKWEYCCYYVPYPPYYYCFECPQIWEDDVTIDIKLIGGGDIVRLNQTIKTSLPDLKWRAHMNGLFRPSSASITIKGEFTDIQKEIVYQPMFLPPPDPSDPYIEIYEYAEIGRINSGDITLLRKP